MKLNITLKRLVDLIAIGFLAISVYLSLAFRASPISFMDPGFPILAESDWNPAPSNLLDWTRDPKRFVSKDEFSEVAYSSQINLDDYSQMFPNPFTPSRIEPTDFVVLQTVIRYSGSDPAQLAFQNAYAEYVGKLTYEILISEIPGLDFSSQADMYRIWCDQVSVERKTMFDPEEVGACYYWAVHGQYFSRTRFSLSSVHGLGRQFSMEMFNDILNRAEYKLVNAPK